MLSFPRVTKMFQFSRLASPAYGFSRELPGFARQGCPIRKSTDSLLPTTRGLSQVTTSFIASRCQGIHRTPLIAWPKNLMLLSLTRFSEKKRERMFQYSRLVSPVRCILHPCIQLSKTITRPAASRLAAVASIVRRGVRAVGSEDPPRPVAVDKLALTCWWR